MPIYTNDLNVDDPDAIDVPLMGISIASTTYTHPMHQHKKGQLLFCNQGIVEVFTEHQYFLISPARAVWLPSGVPHRINSRTPFSFQSLYFDIALFLELPNSIRVLHVNALLRELISRACEFGLEYNQNSAEFRMAWVIQDEITHAADDMRTLVIPRDARLKKAFSYIRKNPGLYTTASSVAEYACITSRTLLRLCQKELGCSFEQWRQQLMMMEALVMLEKNKPISYISDKLGYNSHSAFIARFKQWMGTTPYAYKQILL
ncbi:MAG: helix-turn-helix transcriptional regulator [Legionellaceae bacterium]|nr:helix-turn-helix transcriptional regulator [Legionellaceae bacterium]